MCRNIEGIDGVLSVFVHASQSVPDLLDSLGRARERGPPALDALHERFGSEDDLLYVLLPHPREANTGAAGHRRLVGRHAARARLAPSPLDARSIE